jgi:hypothetical protein
VPAGIEYGALVLEIVRLALERRAVTAGTSRG